MIFRLMGTFEMVANSTGPPASPALLQTAGRRSGRLWAGGFGGVDHLLGVFDFLLGDGTGGIDVNGFLEFGEGSVELAGIAEQLSAMHVGSAGEETQALKGGAVS